MESFATGIVISIDPSIARLGPLVLRWYGIAIAVAITAGLYVALLEGRRKEINEDRLYTCALWSLIGAVVGARICHVVDKLDFYLENPNLLLNLSQGGLAMWGALGGGTIAAAAYCRVCHLSLGAIADAAAPALIVGQMIGRVGSLINGDAWGSTTSLPWGIIYTSENALLPPTSIGVPTHPYPIYEMHWGALTLSLLWGLRRQLRTNGVLFLGFLSLHSIGKFALTFVREEGIAFLGLQQAQVIAAVVLVVAMPVLAYQLAAAELPRRDREGVIETGE